MDRVHVFLIAIVFFIVAINFFMLFFRLKKEGHHKTDRKAPGEAEASKWRAKEIQRRLDREQEDAVRRVELRNKTLELYEQVRKNAENEENSEL